MNRANRHGLLEQLHQLVTWLETDEQEHPELFGSHDEYEWLLRLSAITLSLLTRRKVDDRGRCEWCQRPRRGWHRFVPRWSGQSTCRVLQVAESAAESKVDVLWWRVFGLRGDDITLDEVRVWLQQGTSTVDESAAERSPGAPDYGRHALLTHPPVLSTDAAGSEHPPPVRPYVGPAMPTERFPSPTPRLSEAETEVLPKIDKP